MLILVRKLHQEFVLATSDGEITIVVTAMDRPGRVSFGIDAPESVRIRRGEIDEYRPRRATEDRRST